MEEFNVSIVPFGHGNSRKHWFFSFANPANADGCLREFESYQKLPNVYLAYATIDGLNPKDGTGLAMYCATAGRGSLEASKTAAIAACEAAAKRGGDNRSCKVFDSKSRGRKLAKSDCGVVEAWFQKVHPGYKVFATTAGMPLISDASMACTGQFGSSLSVSTRQARRTCNAQSKLRGIGSSCKIIDSKYCSGTHCKPT